MADLLTSFSVDKLKDLGNAQSQGTTQGIITESGLLLAGIMFPGDVKTFLPPNIKYSLHSHSDTPAACKIRLNGTEEIEINLVLFSNHPGVNAILAYAPSFRLWSTKTRMALLQDHREYQDGWEIIAEYHGQERQQQQFKAIDEVTFTFGVHTMQHRWGDGKETYECGYYKNQPYEVRDGGKTTAGAKNTSYLIGWS